MNDHQNLEKQLIRTMLVLKKYTSESRRAMAVLTTYNIFALYNASIYKGRYAHFLNSNRCPFIYLNVSF